MGFAMVPGAKVAAKARTAAWSKANRRLRRAIPHPKLRVRCLSIDSKETDMLDLMLARADKTMETTATLVWSLDQHADFLKDPSVKFVVPADDAYFVLEDQGKFYSVVCETRGKTSDDFKTFTANAKAHIWTHTYSSLERAMHATLEQYLIDSDDEFQDFHYNRTV